MRESCDWKNSCGYSSVTYSMYIRLRSHVALLLFVKLFFKVVSLMEYSVFYSYINGQDEFGNLL